MKFNKKFIALGLSVSLIASSFVASFATGVQNDNNGNPFAASQLGDWVQKPDGTYGFLYSDAPFKNQFAEDKGLIPYVQQGKYENTSNWSKSEILEASKMGLNNMSIITGYQSDITRKEFCKTIVQAYYKYKEFLNYSKSVPSNIETDIFNDIDKTDDLDIIHAFYLGITKGVGNEKFSPNSKITREEQATMLYRYIELFYPNIAASFDHKNYFADSDKIHTWAKPAVWALGNEEIFLGYPRANNENIGKDFVSNTDFRPLTNTTKEQALCLILRIVKKYIDPHVQHELGQTQNVRIEDETVLTWNAIYGATGYNVYRYEWVSDTETKRTLVKFTNSTSFDLKGLPTGVYDYTVQPVNEWDVGRESEECRVTVSQPVKKNYTYLISNTNNTATLFWANVFHIIPNNQETGATDYRVVITDADGKTVHDTNNIPELTNELYTRYTLTEDLMQNTGTYTIKIYAYNNGFASAPVTLEYTISKQTIDGEEVLFYTPIIEGKTQEAIPQGETTRTLSEIETDFDAIN